MQFCGKTFSTMVHLLENVISWRRFVDEEFIFFILNGRAFRSGPKSFGIQIKFSMPDSNHL